MTTKDTPHPEVHGQAEQIAAALKAGAENPPVFKSAIAMDDKLIEFTMLLSALRECPAADLAAFICAVMRESEEDLKCFQGHPQIKHSTVVTRFTSAARAMAAPSVPADPQDLPLPPIDKSKLH